jgi:hypothetical protein
MGLRVWREEATSSQVQTPLDLRMAVSFRVSISATVDGTASAIVNSAL